MGAPVRRAPKVWIRPVQGPRIATGAFFFMEVTMGKFRDKEEVDRWREEHCRACIHHGAREECAVLRVHRLYGDLQDGGHDLTLILGMLIPPRSSRGNGACAMRYP